MPTHKSEALKKKMAGRMKLSKKELEERENKRQERHFEHMEYRKTPEYKDIHTPNWRLG